MQFIDLENYSSNPKISSENREFNIPDDQIISQDQNIIITKNTFYYFKAFIDNTSNYKEGEKILEALIDFNINKIKESFDISNLNLEFHFKYLLEKELKIINTEYKNKKIYKKISSFIDKKSMLSYPGINYLPICNINKTENLTEEQLWNYENKNQNCFLIDSSKLPNDIVFLDYPTLSEETKNIECANGELKINNTVIELKNLSNSKYFFGGDIILEPMEES